MGEINAIATVAAALEPLNVAERQRVLNWAQGKYGGAVSHVGSQGSLQQQPSANALPSPSSAKAKPSKKSKTVLSMDKNLNLNPAGKPSALDFASQKSPKSLKEKCVVSAYYLRDIISVEKVTAQGVLTFFKNLSWPVPSDLKNTLHQAGAAGWLDTRDSEDIKITSSGENLVEHTLPAKAKSK